MSRPVLVLVQRQPVDEGLLTELVGSEGAELGNPVQLGWFDDPATIPDIVRRAGGRGQAVVVVPAPDAPDLAGLPGGDEVRIVRVDLSLRDADPSPALFCHIQGRGIEGVLWALRTLHHRARWPETIVRYGDHAAQFGAVRPAAARDDGAVPPVVVLLHGGFWRARWQLDLMDALAVDLAERGIASWNVEYRPPDRHGWRSTVDDVRSAIALIPDLAAQFPFDADRVAVLGHSAGGQLAVQAAADARTDPAMVHPKLVVQLAGLVDLVETHRRDLGNGAVPSALGGTPQDCPQVYAAASPLLRLPIGIPQLVVIGRQDGADLREMSRRYARAARAGGDRIELLEDDGDHFTVIDPASAIWSRAADKIAAALLK